MIEGLSCIISRLQLCCGENFVFSIGYTDKLRSLRTKPYPLTSILQLCCVENHRFSHRCNRQAKQNPQRKAPNKVS